VAIQFQGFQPAALVESGLNANWLVSQTLGEPPVGIGSGVAAA
jgi:hypothetical protein